MISNNENNIFKYIFVMLMLAYHKIKKLGLYYCHNLLYSLEIEKY